MKLKAKFYYISFELNNDYNDSRHIDDKEIEELSILAYIEAKTKILQGGNGLNNSNNKNRQELKKKLFSTAAELMMASAK